MAYSFGFKLGIKFTCALVIATYALTSQSALFDDKEARKKILEVETKQLAVQTSNSNALNELKKSQSAIEKRLLAIEAVVQGQGFADMQNQIEALKQELAELKGELELATHNIETTSQRQKDLYTDTDTRLRKIESNATTGNGTTGNASTANGATSTTVADSNIASAPVAATADEKDAVAFSAADILSKSAKHKEAFAAYDLFLREHPISRLVPNALYGMGYSQFALKNYKSSITTQQKLIDLYPESAKVAEAMYNMANSQIQLSQIANAKRTLRELIAKNPNADVTPAAQKRLKMLDAFK